MHARIYKPARSAMQAGRGGTDCWVLEFAPEMRPAADPLMGYTSSGDMLRQVRLEFDDVDEAVAYAERNRIPYRLERPPERKLRPASYADNFRYARSEPWTH